MTELQTPFNIQNTPKDGQTDRGFLKVENLCTWFRTPEGLVKSVNGVSFHIDRGETLALVGESGCGKTVTSLSLIRLLAKSAQIQADSILLNGREIKDLSKEEARKIRGTEISMIFQEPMTSLNPVYRIEKQIGEMIRHEPGRNTQPVRRFSQAGRRAQPGRTAESLPPPALRRPAPESYDCHSTGQQTIHADCR